MGSLIYQWIDLLWLPLGFFAVAPKFRWLTLGFIAACLLMMRMQIELMVYFGKFFQQNAESRVFSGLYRHIYCSFSGINRTYDVIS